MCAQWYDFLTTPGNLDKQLGRFAEDDLISYLRQFLSQAEYADHRLLARKVHENKDIRQESKKSEILDLMAVKVAAQLDFSLCVIQGRGLPLVLQNRLLRVLLNVTAGVAVMDPYQDIDWPGWTPASRFAHALFHKWALQVALENSLVQKPEPSNTPLVAGLTEIPDAVFTPDSLHTRNSVLAQVEVSGRLVEVLCSRENVDMVVPKPGSFCFPSLANAAEHDWTASRPISMDEVRSSLLFSLGRWKFQRMEMNAALEAFCKARAHLQQMKVDSIPECGVSLTMLDAYVTACMSCGGGIHPIRSRLRQQLEDCRSRGWDEEVVRLLMEDLLSVEGPQLGLHLREKTDYETKKRADQGGATEKVLHFQVVTCNLLERVMSGHALVTSYPDLLSSQPAPSGVNFLLAQMTVACTRAAREENKHEMMNLHCFLWFLAQSLPSEIGFMEAFFRSDLAAYFTEDEMAGLRSWTINRAEGGGDDLVLEDIEDEDWQDFDDWYEEDEVDDEGAGATPGASTTPSTSGDTTGSTPPGVGSDCDSLRLLTSYDPEEIHALVVRLGAGPLWNRLSLLNLSDRWRIPPQIAKVLNTSQPNLEQAYAYILIAKSQILKSMEDWKSARLLLNATESALKDSYRLNKMIKNEVTLVDFQEYLLSGDVSRDLNPTELVMRCKKCITAMRIDQDCPPTEELLIACTCLLINAKEWDYLLSATSGYSGPCELGRLLVSVCRDSGQNSGPMDLLQAARHLWEYMCKCLLPRRGQGGNGGGVLSRSQLLELVRLLRSPQLLDLMISALVKMLSTVRSDLNIANALSPYKDIWSSGLPPNSQAHTVSLSETVRCVLEYALSVEPHQVGWLVVRGDLAAADLQYAAALRHYLEAGAAASQYFTRPVPPDVYSERVLQQMMKCCQELRLYGEAIVLSQFVCQVNTAAQLAKDMTDSGDSLDAFLAFIWDVNLLEILTALEAKRGALAKKAKLCAAISLPELNASNRREIQHASELKRKCAFLRVLAEHHLL